MTVCQDCFSNKHLQRYIEVYGIKNYCETCKKASKVLELSSLEEIFSRIKSVYTIDSNGASFFESIQRDLNLFSHGENEANRILNEVYGKEEWNKIQSEQYSLKPAPSLDEEWDEFTESLKHGNRFFTQTNLKDYLEAAFNLLRA
jgi:hypothetical protein